MFLVYLMQCCYKYICKFASNINALHAKSLLICCNECNKLIGIFVALLKCGVSVFKPQCATHCSGSEDRFTVPFDNPIVCRCLTTFPK